MPCGRILQLRCDRAFKNTNKDNVGSLLPINCSKSLSNFFDRLVPLDPILFNCKTDPLLNLVYNIMLRYVPSEAEWESGNFMRNV